jgi:hypothetical protein
MEKQEALRTQLLLSTWLKILLMGVIASIANAVVVWSSVRFISGLYRDTIFTVAASFSGGLIPGLLGAVFYHALCGIIYYFETGTAYFWPYYLYGLCSAAAVVLVRLFARFFPAECESQRIIGGPDDTSGAKITPGSLLIMLSTLSLAMCVVISVMGGLISAGITTYTGTVYKEVPPETLFRLGFLRQGFSLTASEILARFPVNIVERPIAVFGGYGIAVLVKKILELFGNFSFRTNSLKNSSFVG